MTKVNVSLVSLGSLKYPIDFAYLERWRSDIMKISRGSSVGHLPNAEGGHWEYPDAQLNRLVHPDPNADITIALINAPLEGNYYMRRLGENIGILSLFEMADIIRYSDFTIENYILRNVYEAVVLYVANGEPVPSDVYYNWPHDEIRRCLFDMNASKPDIVFSMHKPTLCHDCKNRILSKQIDSAFLPTLEKELLRIKKSLYFLISEWVKKHPLYALGVTAVFGIVLNFVASILFEKAKGTFPWLG